ncbi:hypothetical protein CUMW_222650 [Citrus unshiu]|uniref:Dirigent protein n=1 Tax=Citrus unshiu TaxID=55188 RepID=A0A2H5QEK0_CITUN|nr:hypothetical protein CUMW_222650 [Citrus unshiu]
MSMSFVFINGPNNGCCISLLGNNKLMSPIREMPIDGNIGIFRFGGGYAIAQAHWMDLKFGDAIVGYNVSDHVTMHLALINNLLVLRKGKRNKNLYDVLVRISNEASAHLCRT